MQEHAKEFLLAAVTVAAGIANAYFWKHTLFQQGAFTGGAFYSLPVIVLFVFAACFSLAAAFLRKPLLRSMTALAAVLSGYLFVPATTVVLSAAAVSALGSWYAAERISDEYAASNTFSTRKVLRPGLPIFFTSVAITLAAFYFSSVSASGNTDGVFLPKAMFDVALPLLQKPIANVLPGFRSDASVDQVLLAFAASRVGGGMNIATLPVSERDRLIAEGRKTIAQQFGVTVTGTEKVSDVLYNLTNAQILKFFGPYQRYLPIAAAAAFFIAVKTFTLPVYWLTLLIVAGVVKLLLLLGFLKKETKMIEVEQLSL